MHENETQNTKKERSDAWIIVEQLGKQNRRMFITLLVVLALWAGTIAGFVWYLYQYDFESYYVESTAGPANYIGNDGDIYNGESDRTQENP